MDDKQLFSFKCWKSQNLGNSFTIRPTHAEYGYTVFIYFLGLESNISLQSTECKI